MLPRSERRRGSRDQGPLLLSHVLGLRADRPQGTRRHSLAFRPVRRHEHLRGRGTLARPLREGRRDRGPEAPPNIFPTSLPKEAWALSRQRHQGRHVRRESHPDRRGQRARDVDRRGKPLHRPRGDRREPPGIRYPRRRRRVRPDPQGDRGLQFLLRRQGKAEGRDLHRPFQFPRG